MILAEVRDYLAARGRAPLTDLTAKFDVDADAMRAMLEHLFRKGRVRRIEAPGPCGALLRLRRHARSLRVGGPGSASLTTKTARGLRH